jgi:hypothetical protein
MPPRLHDPEWFVPRLTIKDEQARIRPIRTLRTEQWAIIRALEAFDNVLILKPRQIGCTTITQAWAFHYAWKCPDPVEVLTLTHESGACGRVNNMLRQYWRGLPRPLRGGAMAPDNNSAIGLGHNGAEFRQYMAGGRGQGRSFTNHIFIATEMAFWPQGSASVKGGTAADRDAWASVKATQHEGPHKKTIVESTGDGPSGQFYDLVQVARESRKWAFLFFRWFDFPMYSLTPHPDWERTVEEAELAALYGLTDAQLAWRRMKIADEGYSAMRFRREYPATWQEPFLLSESTWFDGELVNRLLAKVPLHQYESEPGRKYFIGMDTSGGRGGDHAAIVVIRDDYQVCAVWSSNTTAVHEQADMGAKLSAMYNTAVVLCEENNHGRAAIHRMERLGVSTWKDEKGKNYHSLGGRAGQTKKAVYNDARQKVNEQLCCSAAADAEPLICDEDILAEMLIIREDERGRIEAPQGKHDDHVDAYVLALWCGRWHYHAAAKPIDLGQVKLGRIRQARRAR